jgi:hypothetical protein
MRLALACLIVLLSSIVASAEDGLTLSRDGKSDYVVVVPCKATPVELTAAKELQTHLAGMTGATLPIFSEEDLPRDAPRIVVGYGELTKKLLPTLDPTKLPPDAIVIKTLGRDLVLVGHPRRGTLYAVYTLLEDALGVRWWTPTEVRIPKRPTLTLAPVDVSYAPKVIDRATRYLATSDGVPFSHAGISPQEQRQMGLFSARLKLNGADHYTIPAEYGGPNGLIGWVHTFSEINPLLPADKYFKAHPEWYSLIKGKRQHRGAQLCLTNDEMRKELTRNALERLRSEPGATMISVSQNDNNRPCECDRCRAVEDREESPAGLVLQFVNAVAEEVEKEFPDVLVETLAYQYTRKPPKNVRPRNNVIIRLCSIECSFAEPLEAGPQNQKFRSDIEGWSRIAPQLYIWDYVTNFRAYLIPHPNYDVLASNLRYFVRHHAIGLFEQGDSGSRIGEFVRLRAWLLAHLLWNPEADEKKLVDQFLAGYYGPAAPYLREYLDAMSAAVRRSKVYLGCYTPDTTRWLTLDDLERATGLFAKAFDAVRGDAVLQERVRRERLPLDLVWLQRYAEFKREAAGQGRPFVGPADPMAACEEYIRLARQHRVGEYAQGRAFADYEPVLRRLAKEAANKP